MSEDLLTFAVGEILKKVISVAAEEISLAWGIKEEIGTLQASVTMVQAVLQDAEERQVKERAVELWLQRLKDVAYDAEDVLDEFAYEILRRKVEIKNKLKMQVRNFFSPSNPVPFHLKMSHKVKKINQSLDKIKSDAAGFGLRVGSVDRSVTQTSQRQETDSLLDNSDVIGRSNEVSDIVSLLISSSSKQSISVFSIVGMPGLGKTTLARLVSKEVEEKKLFDVTMWACVSDNFDDRRILGGMLESLDKTAGGLTNIDAILRHLREKLDGKKFLLVLDDVWNKELEKWDSLKSRLLKVNRNNGNIIVVTTRSEQVASMMETLHIHRHYPKKLSNDECWSIIKDVVFASAGVLVPLELEAIGREIAKRCGGLPLLARVLGGTMLFKRERNEWLSIRDSEMWDLAGGNNGILPILKLSFDRLPSPSLKRCFAYCALFHKDFVIEKDKLIQLWMAEGFLQPYEACSMTMEDIGDEYFQILLANSLFQDVERDELGGIMCCKMHDVVHDLVQFVSRYETWTSEVSPINHISHIRYLNFFHHREMSARVIGRVDPRKLHSLFSKVDVFDKISWSFKSLRVLNLYDAYIQNLSDSIGKLKHLRYLDVSRTRISILPRSISKLYNLQTLRLLKCSYLRHVPKGVDSLVSLRHIYFDDPILIPDQIGRLTCLQTLPMFVVGTKKSLRIEQLSSLKQLRGELAILKLEHVRDKVEAMRADVKGKPKLYELTYEWSSGRESCNNDGDVLEGLQPHPNLQRLMISNFMGDKFPSWFGDPYTLCRLVKLKLKSCQNCVELPTLGHLPCLKGLKIIKMRNVKRIAVEFYNASSISGEREAIALFVSLRKLELQWMEGLEEWIVPASTCTGEATVVFPCLEELTVCCCPQLTSVPLTQLKSLQRLRINSCHKLSDLGIVIPTSKISIEELIIDNCRHLISIPVSQMTCLRSLNIQRCDKLRDLGIADTAFRSSIEELTIENCPQLRSVPISRLTCLQSLLINKCDDLSNLGNGAFPLAPLKTLEIRGCLNLSSIPGIPSGVASLENLVIWECGLTCLPNRLRSCNSLRKLIIAFCPYLMYVPEDLGELSSLVSLMLWRCPKLTRLPERSLCNLTCLKVLEIGGFLEELKEFPDLSFIQHLHSSLEELELQGWHKLKSLPHQLQHLTSLNKLKIYYFHELEAIPEWFGNLSSLHYLEIQCCNNIKHLPSVEAMRQLTNLQWLYINSCRLLEERCKRDSGPEWSKISHIPKIIGV